MAGPLTGNVETSTSAADRAGLSVVIPNFNHAAHLTDAVRAVAEQNPAPAEIIVVDDASTDDSLAVLERLGRVYSQLRVVALQSNGGAIRALNRGLQEAREPYVYFGAADDLTKPGLFRATLELLERYPDAAFASAGGHDHRHGHGADFAPPCSTPITQGNAFQPA